jgi:Asparagine synthase
LPPHTETSASHTSSGSRLLRLTPLESAVDTASGDLEGVPPLPEVDRAWSPIDALEEAIRPALERPPCLVGFSGGRDSSAVLAVATRLARRERLSPPIPATYRYPENPEAEESHWQELVIRHLALSDWQRFSFRDELDLIGPIAQRVLRRHGLLAPSATYTAIPMLEASPGGSLLTGMDGDGLLGAWGSGRAWGVLSGQLRPAPRDVLRIARAAAPAAVRQEWFRRRRRSDICWLKPTARQALNALWAKERASEPARWDRRMSWWARRRHLAVVRQSMDLLAGDHDVRVSHPLMDPGVLAALARFGGRSGFGDRAIAMRRLFGEFLPAEILSREDKADFTSAVWNEGTREFATAWQGGGLASEIVDEDGLRLAWATPDARAGLLLQAAWLLSVDGKLERQANCSL